MDFVDFGDIPNTGDIKKVRQAVKYQKDGKKIVLTDVVDVRHEISKEEYDRIYDFETTRRYKSFRLRKEDPITCDELTDENAFKFEWMWDCLTGERTSKDPYGPMYIHPVALLQTFCQSVLDGLWIEMDGCFPSYGENLGKGDEFYVEGKGRGSQPEKYLFRFPIKDCYVHKDQDQSIHTMGPKLTDEEVAEIDRLITEHWLENRYVRKINYQYTNGFTTLLKQYYDIAIHAAPTILEHEEKLPLKLNNQYQMKVAAGHLNGTNHDTYLNRIAVDAIKELIGHVSKF